MENKSIKTQIQIVKCLLDGSIKSQRQIADEIGKEESTISKALAYLIKEKTVNITPKIIKSGRKNKGLYKNNQCQLSYHSKNGVNVLMFFKNVLNSKTLKKYEAEEIIDTLRSSDKFIGVLRDSFMRTNESSQRDCVVTVQFYEVRLPQMLNLSPSFFEYFLNIGSTTRFWKNQDKLTVAGFILSKWMERGYFEVSEDMETIFEHFVFSDVLKGCSNPEAMEWVNQKHKNGMQRVSFDDISFLDIDEKEGTFTIIRKNETVDSYFIEKERDVFTKLYNLRNQFPVYSLSSEEVDEHGNKYYQEE